MKRSRRPKKPSKYQVAAQRIHSKGYQDGYRMAQLHQNEKIKQLQASLDEERAARNTEVLRQSAQAIQSLSVLGEAFARVLMYGTQQRFPGKDQKNSW